MPTRVKGRRYVLARAGGRCVIGCTVGRAGSRGVIGAPIKGAQTRLGARLRRVKTLDGIHKRIVTRDWLALSWMEVGRRY